ncbi:MAG: helix-turn-helix transcriptional regulator [Myxococcota bacterium]
MSADKSSNRPRIHDPSLGSTLKALRIEAGKSQGELAEELGVDRTTISRIEQGTRSTGFALVQKWYRACGYELDAIQIGEPHESLSVMESLAQIPDEDRADVTRFLVAWPTLSERAKGRLIGFLDGYEAKGVTPKP